MVRGIAACVAVAAAWDAAVRGVSTCGATVRGAVARICVCASDSARVGAICGRANLSRTVVGAEGTQAPGPAPGHEPRSERGDSSCSLKPLQREPIVVLSISHP